MQAVGSVQRALRLGREAAVFELTAGSPALEQERAREVQTAYRRSAEALALAR